MNKQQKKRDDAIKMFGDQFEFELNERISIMGEKDGNYDEVETPALEATLKVWLNK